VVEASVRCAPGEIVCIVGPVGSGKSTLLKTIAGAIPAARGRPAWPRRARRAYVAQRPFLASGTVRDNILFGLPDDVARLDDVVERSRLGPDVSSWPLGLATAVGPSGVQLSGGQQARVALARALFARPNVAILDDVLSAVDAHTGAALWDDAIVPLARTGCRVVIATHQLAFSERPEVSRVVSLGDCAADAASRDDDADAFEDAGDAEAAPFVETRDAGGGELVTLDEVEAELTRRLRESEGRTVDSALIQDVVDGLRTDDRVEKRREGFIAWPDFRVYLRAFGTDMKVAILIALALAGCGLSVAANIWLSLWADGGGGAKRQREGLAVYVGIGLVQAVVLCLQTIALTLCALGASTILHGKMLSAVLDAPMRFFDATPAGAVLNRFLQDLANVDMDVPTTTLDQLTRTLSVASQLGLVLWFAPWVAATLPLILLPYVFIFRTVRVAARDARRLEAAAHGPCYAHFNDAIRGRETIRAFGAIDRFEAANLKLTDAMATGRYANEAASKWSQALTTQNGCLLYLAAGLTSVALVARGDMTTGQLGLVLLYSASLQRAAMDYMTGLTTLESQFVSVERVAQYCRLEGEAGGGRAAPTSSKPVALAVRNVALRYRLHRPLVLRGVSFDAAAGEKIAVCGRTGSGKSSLFSAIARLYPLSSGSVAVDGVDLAGLALADARSRVRVVAQEATLRADTLRANLVGPYGADVDDESIWAALKLARVDGAARRVGLDHVVAEAGEDFSAGERQLLSLARALLPAPPGLLLADECSANVDERSDAAVHDVLLQELDATVLVISHRLQLARRFDRVVVLDNGRVVECGRPRELLAAPESLLSGLVRAQEG